MSMIKKALGKTEEIEEETFTKEQEEFLQEEGFVWNDEVGWILEEKQDEYNLLIYARMHYFDLTIYQGEYVGEGEVEEVYYWFSQTEFDNQFKTMVEKIETFFEEKH